MDKLIKWGYFIACTEEILAEDVAKIYIKEVVCTSEQNLEEQSREATT